MLLRKFTNLYPRTLWIAVIEDEEDIVNIRKQFTIFKVTEGFNEVNDDPKLFYEGMEHAVAECVPVSKNSNYELGVLCLIYRSKDFDNSYAAHESVHIADYYFEITGMGAQDLSEPGGNEHYAYLVGWSAGCFTKVMKEYYGKTK